MTAPWRQNGRKGSREINHTRREGEKKIGMKTRPSCLGVFVCVCICMISDEQTVMSLVNASHSTRSLQCSVYNDHYCFTAIIMMTTETSLVLPLRRLSLSVNDPLIQNLAGLLVLWTEEVL